MEMTVVSFIETVYPDGPPSELVFYGGSFNPWHAGHSVALSKMADKHVIVMPDRNPLKPINPFSLEESLENIRSELTENKWLYEAFLNRRTHNPTAAWIHEVRMRFPEMKIALLMGFDNFVILDKWQKADQLLSDLDRIYILSRNDDESTRVQQSKNLLMMNPGLDMIFLGKHEYEDVSSSSIRAGSDYSNKNLTLAI
jgi:nicotinate-nucleotide adenylyltransferase